MQKILAKLPYWEQCGDGYKALCPTHSDLKPSLSISHGEGGRVLLHCHAGCPTEKILDKLGLTWADLSGDGSPASVPRRPRPADADLDHRHDVYSTLIDALRLDDEHREQLRKRGLTDERIAQNQYRTLSLPETAQIAARLHEKYGAALYRVPGFWDRPHNGPRLTQNDGLLIPVRDPRGRVIACQVRLGEGSRKYIWLSSEDARSGSPSHVPLRHEYENVEVVRVTEGPLKADVSSLLSGVPTIGVASVSAWEPVLPLLRELNPKEVHVAFDADWKSKPPVREQLVQFMGEIRKAGLCCRIVRWDPAHKGLDDALLAGAPVAVEGEEVSIPHPESLRGDLADYAHIIDVLGVEAKAVEWLWSGWVPYGSITVLDGDPGLGKSILTCALASAVSSGGVLPRCEQPTPVGAVLILSAEDDVSRTLKPRLRVAGADVSRVHLWAGVKKDVGGQTVTSLPTFPDDADTLRRAILAYEVKLVIIDPLYAYFADSVDAFKDQHVRRVLSVIHRVAEETRAAILVVRHLNKMSNQGALYRGSGSIGVIGQARSGLFFLPDDEDQQVRHLFQTKCNMARCQDPLRLRIASEDGYAKVVWDSDSDRSIEHLLKGVGKRGRPGVMSAREQWILAELIRRGPTSAKELSDVAFKEFGWTFSQLKEAKEALKLRSTKKGSEWVWHPPVDPRALETGCGEQEQAEGRPAGEADSREAKKSRRKGTKGAPVRGGRG